MDQYRTTELLTLTSIELQNYSHGPVLNYRITHMEQYKTTELLTWSSIKLQNYSHGPVLNYKHGGE